MRTSVKILKIALPVLFLILLNAISIAQPAEVWSKTYFNPNGTGSDYSDKTIIDNQGNTYIACATRTQNTSDDIMVLKYNSAGLLQWSKTYNYSYNGTEQPNDICLDNSGNIYVTGTSTRTQGGYYDCVLLKFDPNGNILWVKRINKTNYADRKSEGVSLAFRDGIYVGVNYIYNGWSESGIAKYSAAGDSVAYLQTGFLSNFSYRMWKMVQDNNLNIYAIYSGDLLPNEEEDLVVKKIGTNGSLSLIWTKTYTGASHLNDRARDIAVGPDGNIFITGHTYVSNQGANLILMKFGRDDGAVLMQKTYNDAINNQDDYGVKVSFDNNLNILVAGGTSGFNTPSNILMLKYSPTGTLMFTKTYDHAGSSIDGMRDLQTDNYGNFYIAGDYTDQVQQTSGLYTLKFSQAGELDWAIEKNMQSNIQSMRNININSDGSLIVTADYDDAGTRKIMLIKYGSTIGIEPVSGTLPEKFELSQNYPNPFNPSTNINFSIPVSGKVKLSVFDVSGREVAVLVNKDLAAGTYKADFNASMLSSGVYFYRINAGDFTDVKKMMLVK